jgi:hypothetical protein
MIRLDSPMLLAVALALVAGTVLLAAARRINLRPITRSLLVCGLVLLALAAGGLTVERPRAGYVAVMVDVSPSTRTATYRDPAELSRRVGELLGGARFRVYEFAGERRDTTLGAPLNEWPADRTALLPPVDADAVLLLSDGRFDPPATSPPVYAVIDPKLSQANDARVQRLEVRDGTVVAAVANEWSSRTLTITGAEPVELWTSRVVTQPLGPHDGAVTARLDAADAWPENDALTIFPPPPEQLERWWVGSAAPSAQWRTVAPQELPSDPVEYLRASVIVLDNVAADSLSAAQQDRLLQYARDLGGGVILLGGDRAFAAGGYPGTALEQLSPLSSTPPAPATHWVILADASGSMAAPAGGSTRWRAAADALARVLPSLPPDDPVSVGSFARDLRWWSRGKSARETARSPPSVDVAPQGPTNLQPALESILAGGDGSVPIEVLLLSDADTQLDAATLATSMRAKRVRVHLLATAEIGAENPVKRLVETTGGALVTQADPQQWAAALRELLRGAAPDYLGKEPLDVRFTGPLGSLPGRAVEVWNRVWPMEQATPVASAAEDERRVMASLWSFGTGRIAAAAFRTTPDESESLAALVAARPRDPRLTVTWDAGSALRVSVDAVDGARPINGLKLVLELSLTDGGSSAAEAHPIPQVGPGRYELVLPAPRSTRLASVRHEGNVIDRRALAGRYAPEFDAIGTDRSALRELATRTGGRLIEPTDTQPINFAAPRRTVDLTSYLAAAGAALVAGGLIHWRIW